MQELLLPLAIVAGLSMLLWVALAIAESPVHPSRLNRFGRRYGLLPTADSGNHIIAYLAITRRWRAFGLVVGVIVSIVSGLPGIQISSLPLFAGWFVGALIAELRVLPPPFGPRRAALVAPRKMEAYLRPFARALLLASVAPAFVLGLLRMRDTWPWTLAALAVALAVWRIQLRVLHRSQPAAPADVIAADDAIRSRSLHVLAGGGSALVLFCVLAQLTELGLVPVAGFLGFAVVALLGWTVANSGWRVVRVS